MSYLLALDQGTTSSRAIVFTDSQEIAAAAQKEFTQHYPQPGWVEHDAREIWATQLSVAVEALAEAGLKPSDVSAVGITNQRETTVVWDRRTGQPVYQAIVWQDRRTAPMCERLKSDGLEPLIQRKTGLVLDPYFSGTKLRWILDQVGQRDGLAFGTVDSWLIWNLTGGRVHATDPSNASRTLLYNIHEQRWDNELLEIFGIPESVLPKVMPSSGVFGLVDSSILPGNVPIAGDAGDQQAALFGQACFEPGLTKNTYGTGCFMLMQTGTKAVASENRLLTTCAWTAAGQADYALEGSVFIGGAVVQWLRDGLGVIQSAPEVEALAASVPDSGGISLVPAFTGLGAPYWDPHARGLITGITRGTTKAHIARAALEAIAHQSADLLLAMQADSGDDLKELRVDGGASANNLLMQIQADLLGIPVTRAAVTETTALGAACLAGLATGVYSSLGEIALKWRAGRTFEPSISRERAAEARRQWLAAVSRARPGKAV
jgi:glycerol kinase